MKLINITPVYNSANHSWLYIAFADDGFHYHRSSSGRWGRVTTQPVSFLSVCKDFDIYISQNPLVSENDIKEDNASLVIVSPTPVAEPPEAEPEPAPDPEIEPPITLP